MDSDNISKLFDAYYFAHGCGTPYGRSDEWLALFNSIADGIVKHIQPKTVLDAGCAMGLLVEALRQRGVEAYGVDISEYAIQNLRPSVQEYCWLGSVTDALSEQYDLIISIEVLEHMPSTDAEKAIDNFCQHSNDILFSSTPFDFKEITHFNVQPPEKWAELFALLSFYRDVDFDASFITPWAVRFRRKNEVLSRLVREYERKFFLLWKENVDLRNLVVEMRDELEDNEQLDETYKSQLSEKNSSAQVSNMIFTQKFRKLIKKPVRILRRIL